MKFSNFFKSKDSAPKKNNKILQDKYLSFQTLLNNNDNVLILMADLEDKLKSEYLFDQKYITSSVESIRSGVEKIISSLNHISHGKYKELVDRFENINTELDHILFPRREIPVSDLVIPLDRLNDSMSAVAGRKIARLGDMRHRLNLPIPDGFSITAYAFKRFLEHNNLTTRIGDLLRDIPVTNTEDLIKLCNEMKKTVMAAEIPPELLSGINDALFSLKSKNPHRPLLTSVRSSAVHEDGDISFAGQYSTFLNVPEHLVAQKYKEVVASIFRPRAVYYFKTKGFSEADMVMPVGVLQMIDAEAGGVAYSRDPTDPGSDKIVINAARGLGKTVVDGTIIPHTFTVSRMNGNILEKVQSDQRAMLVCVDSGDITEREVMHEDSSASCVSDDSIERLAELALQLERQYGKPQDIEWAIGKDRKLYLLQSRGLRTTDTKTSLAAVPRKLDRYPLLIDKGLIASRGIGYGRVCIVRDVADIKSFPDGGVLVAENMSADFVLAMDKATAMVADMGGITGHMASLAREYGVPTIVNTKTATTILKQGQEITVDAVNCNVYEGKAEELLKYASHESSFRDTRVYRILEQVFERIGPLNLVHPDADIFTPANCRTYHDITRFSHEKAMSEMFSLGTDHDMDECHAIPLRAGIPMDAHLIDLGGGIADGIVKATEADILSAPFAAFLRGMKGMRWPEPRPADMKGFLGMVANTAQIPESQLEETANRSYAVITSHYMNFSIRLGYHFSAVEAFSDEKANSNYIKFHFKGGGATSDRRLRRIRLITEILRNLNFAFEVAGDILTARLMKYGKKETEDTLEVLGKLTAYTKQLDMAMYNDAITDLFIEDFLRDHANKPK
jgi:pyruvate, water dikinase